MALADKIVIKSNPMIDLLAAIVRMMNNDYINKIASETYGIGYKKDEYIQYWVEENSLKLPNYILDIQKKFIKEIPIFQSFMLEFYFRDIDTIEKVNEYFSAISAREIVKDLLGFVDHPGEDEDISDSLFDDDREKILFLKDLKTLNAFQKSYILDFLDNPEETKEDMIKIINFYYDNFFKEREKEFVQINIDYGDLIKQNIKKLGDNYIKSLFLMDISSVLEESHEIGIYTNYFFDLYRDVFISKKNEEEETFKNNERILLIIGYNLVKNISIKQNPESILAKVFSNLSNEKTLKILKFLDNNESERREISDRLGMTMDEINFAVGFLLSANIINIELGRKLTYQFSSKAFIEKISKILSDFFNK
jgi:hypothetical protein